MPISGGNPLGTTGFEPRTTAPERRAFFDLIRRFNEIRVPVDAVWNYSTNTSAPPGTGEIRSDGADTKIWLHQIDKNGYYRDYELQAMNRGDAFVLRGLNGSRAEYEVLNATRTATYFEYDVTLADLVGSVNPNADILVTMLVRPGQKIIAQ